MWIPIEMKRRKHHFQRSNHWRGRRRQGLKKRRIFLSFYKNEHHSHQFLKKLMDFFMYSLEIAQFFDINLNFPQDNSRGTKSAAKVKRSIILRAPSLLHPW